MLPAATSIREVANLHVVDDQSVIQGDCPPTVSCRAASRCARAASRCARGRLDMPVGVSMCRAASRRAPSPDLHDGLCHGHSQKEYHAPQEGHCARISRDIRDGTPLVCALRHGLDSGKYTEGPG